MILIIPRIYTLLIFFLFLSTNLFSGNDFSVYITEANINARSTYRIQSNTSCRQIEQDQNNPEIINVCWMVSQSIEPGFPDRKIRYFFSDNGGNSFNYLGPISATRSGFGVMDIFSDGRVLIGCHSSDMTSNANVHFYHNLDPGSGSFSVITSGSSGTSFPIWPQVKILGPNRFIFTGGGNDIPGIVRNACNAILPAPVFTGYQVLPGANNINLAAIASNENRTAIAYIADDQAARKIFLVESTDGGLTFGNPLIVWGQNSDSIKGLRGIDCSYDGEVPNVVFEVNKWNYNQGSWSPYEPSKIYFWSPAINNSNAVMIDSSGGLTGNSSHIYTSVSRPVIGYSNPRNLIYAAYHKARNDTNEAGENYFDIMISYSNNEGSTWSIPQQITNQSGVLLDNKYVSISNKNSIIGTNAEVHLLFQQDTIPGVNVPPTVSVMSRMMYAKLSMPVIGVEPISSIQPEKFILKQNYPNPFNNVTQIEFSVPENSFVKLKIYNSAGELVSILAEDEMARGSYKADFNAANLASGVYYYVMEYSEENSGRWNSISKKMVLIK